MTGPIEVTAGLDSRVGHAASPWLDGRQSTALTLVHAVLAAGDARATAASLRRLAHHEPRLHTLAALAETRSHGLDRILSLLHTIEHDAPRDTSAIAAMFDRAVAQDEISSVALYALGDDTLLQDATDEIVEALAPLLAPATRLLDLGCGIGRFAGPLAQRVHSYRGLDISSGMLAAAQRRDGARSNVTFELCDGRSLAGIADGAIDLALAVDVAPYWHQASVVDAMLAELRRVLVPGGVLALFGWSYRNDDDADRRDAQAGAASHGFAVHELALARFQYWDAPSFLFRAI